MSLKAYLWTMRLVTATAFALFLLVVYQVDPETSGLPGKLFFYASLFLFLSGSFILILSWARRKSEGPVNAGHYLGTTFRQGSLLAGLVNGLLLLQSFRMLVWWSGLILVFGVFLVEIYYLLKEQR